MMKRDKKCKILKTKSAKVCSWVMILNIYIHLNIGNKNWFAEEKNILYLLKYYMYYRQFLKCPYEMVRNGRHTTIF